MGRMIGGPGEGEYLSLDEFWDWWKNGYDFQMQYKDLYFVLMSCPYEHIKDSDGNAVNAIQEGKYDGKYLMLGKHGDNEWILHHFYIDGKPLIDLIPDCIVTEMY